MLVIYHASLAHAKLEVARPGRTGEADYVPVYTFASQQPPHVPAPIKKIAPAIEVVEELQDPSLGWFTTP